MDMAKQPARREIIPYISMEMEEKIIAALTTLEKVRPKASTSTIAKRLGLSRVQMWRYLKILEQKGIVQKVGEKNGWKLVPRSRYEH